MKPATRRFLLVSCIKSYLAGVFNTMKKHLSVSGQKLLPLIERAFFCMRCFYITALPFHVVAHSLTNMLLVQQPSEKKAADVLLQCYFVKLPAHETFGLREWPSHARYLITANWRTVQPGSASGTQAQESWHKHKLKQRFKFQTGCESCGQAQSGGGKWVWVSNQVQISRV